jgi:hypothetical protein
MEKNTSQNKACVRSQVDSQRDIGVQNVGWLVGPNRALNRPAAAAARHDSGSQTTFFPLETVTFSPTLDETPMRDMAPAISDDEYTSALMGMDPQEL